MIGILGAMESEIRGLVSVMEVEDSGRSAGFDYWTGRIAGRECVIARSGMGKVAAAAGVQRLIDQWRVDLAVVCGLAGALSVELKAGDIVVGQRFIQHDVDASPIFPRFQLPGLEVSFLDVDPALVAAAQRAAEAVVSMVMPLGARQSAPRVHTGLIVTGDQFIKDDKRFELLLDFPEALCVEMEGGAIAQVCYLNSVPFIIVRVISDNADEEAAFDFSTFAEQIAPAYAVALVQELLAALPPLREG
jgi:adenosylhomocysteine nucleosidase